MEEAIEEPLVTQEQWIEFMRKSEYHMKVRGINDFRPAFVYPDFFFDSLAAGAVPVTAGVIVKFHIPAVWTLGNIYSKFSGFTVQDSPGSFTLDIGLEVSGRSILLIGMMKDLLDFEVMHKSHLPSGRTG